MEKLKGRSITFRNPEQFVDYLVANKINEVFVHLSKRQKYGDEYDGHATFDGANDDKNLLVRYYAGFVIPRQQGTELDNKGRIVESFKSKQELIDGLKSYGASADMLKKFSTTKASELREFFDDTKVDQPDTADTRVEETSTKTVRTTPQAKEALLNHEHFKVAEISFDGHKYHLTLTLKVTPADAAKQLRGRLKEAKIQVFDAKLSLWQTTPEE